MTKLKAPCWLFFVATLAWSPSQAAGQENSWEAAISKGNVILSNPGEFSAGQFAEWLVQLPPNPTQSQTRTVAEFFFRSMTMAPPSSHAKLINNYGIFLLKQQHYAQAADLFEQLDGAALSRLAPSTRARFHYNQARAFQLGGQSDLAAQTFSKAIEAHDEFALAYERLFELALVSPKPVPWRVAISAANRLLANGRHSQTSRFARDVLTLPPDPLRQAMSLGFMPFIIDFFQAAHVTPQRYVRDWHPPMKGAWTLLGLPVSEWSLAEGHPSRDHELEVAFSQFRVLDAVHRGAFGSPNRYREQMRVLGSLPLKLDEARWSGLFETAGKDFLKNKKYFEAANLFILAWECAPYDTEAGLYLSNTLLEGGTEVDPEGEIFDYLIQNSYQGKGQAYKMDNPVLIYRFHVLLGTIFSARKTWDSERAFYGARKQWTMAAKWFERLKQNPPPGTEQEFTLAPGLYANLGLANKNSTGHGQEAWNAFTTATEQFIELDNRTAARQVFNQRETLPMTMRGTEVRNRNRELIQQLFLPENGDRRTAAAVASHVTWLASGKTRGKRANFKRLDLKEYDFSGLDLAGTDFGGADLRGATFTRTNLANANFSRANLNGATFLNANLENANLKNAKLNNTYLERSTLKKEQLSEAQLRTLDQKSLRNFSP